MVARFMSTSLAQSGEVGELGDTKHYFVYTGRGKIGFRGALPSPLPASSIPAACIVVNSTTVGTLVRRPVALYLC